MNYKKITQALNYLALQCGDHGCLNKMKAIKLLFFADRYHLRKYGRPVTHDEYHAMGYGPVGSIARDIVEASVFLDSDASGYSEKFLNIENKYDYKTVQETDDSVFSESDKEALNFSISIFSKFNQWELAEISHAYPEWKKHEEGIKSFGGSYEMKYDEFFENPSPDEQIIKVINNGVDFFCNVMDDQAKDIYLENQKIEKLWK